MNIPETQASFNGGKDNKMPDFTHEELCEAHRALLSTLKKCETIDASKLGKSQRTLLERRVAAFKVALALIEKEQKSFSENV
jgi:hypothetical protein